MAFLPCLLMVVACFGGAVYTLQKYPPCSNGPSLEDFCIPRGKFRRYGKPFVTALRVVFVAVIFGTLASSYLTLSEIKFCDSNYNCVKFAGWVQFTTFTRWCWMIQGAYHVGCLLAFFSFALEGEGGRPGGEVAKWPRSNNKAAVARVLHVLYQISWAMAMLVTIVTYTVLVPAAVVLPMPPHKSGAVAVLLSWQGHVMHSANTIMMATDYRVTGKRANLRDFAFNVFFSEAYVVFSWWFHSQTNIFHYPFLDYNLRFPIATLCYGGLTAVGFGCWYLVYAITGQGKKSA